MVQHDISNGPSDVGPDVSERPRSAAGKATGHEAWYSGAGLRRRFSKSHLHVPKPRDQDSPEAEQGRKDEKQAHKLGSWKPATYALAVVALTAVAVAALTLTGVITAPRQGQPPRGDHMDVAAYLNGLASWREEAPQIDLDPYHAVQPTPEECAAADALPAVQILCAAAADKLAEARREQPAQRAQQARDVDSLALDCSLPQHADACAAAAGVNNYGGGQEQESVVSEEVLEAHWTLEASLATSNGASVPSDLDSLALDCEADLAACQAAAAVNSYEGPSAGSIDTAASESWMRQQTHDRQELEAGFAAPGHVRALDLDCSAAATQDAGRLAACAAAAAANRYEGAETWARTRRIATEAAPEHVGVRYLDLDCSDQEADMQAECQRSKAANRYETRPSGQAAAAAATAAAAQAGRAQAAAEAYRLRYKNEADLAAEHGRQVPVGGGAAPAEQQQQLPAPQQYAAAAGAARTLGYDVGAADAQDELPALSDHPELSQYRAAVRTVGYDVPAVEWDPIASQVQYRQQHQEQHAQVAGGESSRHAKRRGNACSCGQEHHDPYHELDRQIEAAQQRQQQQEQRQQQQEQQQQQHKHQHEHEHDHHQQSQHEQHAQARTPGFDVPAVDIAGEAEQHYVAESAYARTVGYDAAAAAGDEGWQPPEQRARDATLRYRRAARTVGYDMPAVDTVDAAAAQHLAAESAGTDDAASAGQAQQQQAAAAKRVYYKQPLNSPSARKHYKDDRSTKQHRVYYKNPANAPMQPASPAPPQQKAEPLDTRHTWTLAAQVAAYLAVGVVSAAYLLARRRRAAAAAEHSHEGRVPRVSSIIEAADQLLSEAASGATMADPIPDHVDSPRATNFDSPRLARKAELAARLEAAGMDPHALQGEVAPADEDLQLPPPPLLRSPRIARAVSPVGRSRTPVAASPLSREVNGKPGDAADL